MKKHRHTKGCRKLGQRLRKLREAREWTLQEAADAIRISKSHMWELEAGKNTNPTIGLMMSIAKQFDTSIDALVRP